MDRMRAAAPSLYDALRECLALLRELGPDTSLTEHAGYVALALAESETAYRAAVRRYEIALEGI